MGSSSGLPNGVPWTRLEEKGHRRKGLGMLVKLSPMREWRGFFPALC